MDLAQIMYLVLKEYTFSVLNFTHLEPKAYLMLLDNFLEGITLRKETDIYIIRRGSVSLD